MRGDVDGEDDDGAVSVGGAEIVEGGVGDASGVPVDVTEAECDADTDDITDADTDTVAVSDSCGDADAAALEDAHAEPDVAADALAILADTEGDAVDERLCSELGVSESVAASLAEGRTVLLADADTAGESVVEAHVVPLELALDEPTSDAVAEPLREARADPLGEPLCRAVALVLIEALNAALPLPSAVAVASPDETTEALGDSVGRRLLGDGLAVSEGDCAGDAERAAEREHEEVGARLPDAHDDPDALGDVVSLALRDGENVAEPLRGGDGLALIEAVAGVDAEGVRVTCAETDDVPQLLCVGDSVRDGSAVGDDGALGVRTADGVVRGEGDERTVPEVVADPMLVRDAVAHTLPLEVASRDAVAAGDAVTAADIVPAAVALEAADALATAVAEPALLPEALPVPAPLADAVTDGVADVDCATDGVAEAVRESVAVADAHDDAHCVANAVAVVHAVAPWEPDGEVDCDETPLPDTCKEAVWPLVPEPAEDTVAAVVSVLEAVDVGYGLVEPLCVTSAAVAVATLGDGEDVPPREPLGDADALCEAVTPAELEGDTDSEVEGEDVAHAVVDADVSGDREALAEFVDDRESVVVGEAVVHTVVEAETSGERDELGVRDSLVETVAGAVADVESDARNDADGDDDAGAFVGEAESESKRTVAVEQPDADGVGRTVAERGDVTDADWHAVRVDVGLAPAVALLAAEVDGRGVSEEETVPLKLRPDEPLLPSEDDALRVGSTVNDVETLADAQSEVRRDCVKRGELEIVGDGESDGERVADEECTPDSEGKADCVAHDDGEAVAECDADACREPEPEGVLVAVAHADAHALLDGAPLADMTTLVDGVAELETVGDSGADTVGVPDPQAEAVSDAVAQSVALEVTVAVSGPVALTEKLAADVRVTSIERDGVGESAAVADVDGDVVCDAVARELTDGDGVALEDEDVRVLTLGEAEPPGVRERDAVAQLDTQALCVTPDCVCTIVLETEGVGLWHAVEVMVADESSDVEAVIEGVAACDGEPQEDAVALAVVVVAADELALTDADSTALAVCVPESVMAPVDDTLAVSQTLGESTAEDVALILAEPDAVMLAVGDGDAEGDEDGRPEEQAVGDDDDVGEIIPLALAQLVGALLAVTETLAVIVADALADEIPVGDLGTVAVGRADSVEQLDALTLEDWQATPVAVGVCEADAVADTVALESGREALVVALLHADAIDVGDGAGDCDVATVALSIADALTPGEPEGAPDGDSAGVAVPAPELDGVPVALPVADGNAGTDGAGDWLDVSVLPLVAEKVGRPEVDSPTLRVGTTVALPVDEEEMALTLAVPEAAAVGLVVVEGDSAADKLPSAGVADTDADAAGEGDGNPEFDVVCVDEPEGVSLTVSGEGDDEPLEESWKLADADPDAGLDADGEALARGDVDAETDSRADVLAEFERDGDADSDGEVAAVCEARGVVLPLGDVRAD